MKVAIIGSRRRKDRDAVVAAVQALQPGTIVVSGGCEGPDEWAADAARHAGLAVVEHLPDTAGCRRRFEFTKAYYARNQLVANDCDRVVAFVAPDRKGGTEDTIKRALKAGKPVEIL
jgi:predicted Rossmann fold nucleotide-binding protein DprA/Smf involved in DNA uptake